MKIIIIQIISRLIRIFTRIDNQKLYWYDRGYNGSNLYFLRIDKYLKKIKYRKVYTSTYIKQNKKPLKNLIAVIKDIIEFYQSKLIIHTHGISYRPKNKQIVINVWHGIPLKSIPEYSLKKKDESFSSLNYIKSKLKYDYLLSTSQIATYFLNRFNRTISKNVIYTGYPRNDLILETIEDSIKFLINPDFKHQKHILYAPTFRDKNSLEEWPLNPIFDSKKIHLNEYLDKQDIMMYIKPHPNELGEFEKLQSKNIKIIDSNWLKERKINFYSLLNMLDLLITDYSSIYYDFLLADKPIVFFNYDFEAYSRNRTLMIDEFDQWAPGHKTKSIEELINSIDDALKKDPFKNDRQRLRNDIHIFKDNRSTERFIEFMNSL